MCVEADVSDLILNAAGLLRAGVDWDGSMCDAMSVTGVVSLHGDCGLSWAVWSAEQQERCCQDLPACRH